LAQALGFDVIFCRNLLIYFDPIRQKQAIAVLGRVLKDDGTLFVGHSEAGLMRSEGFASAGLAMAFAFQKTVAQPALGEPKAQLAAFIPASRHRTPAPPLRRMMVTPAARRDRQSPAIATRNVSPPDLRTLRRMADDGRLDEAERGCHAHIRAKGASADALLLLALISDASGQGKVAAHYYRKALYLDPDNVEALGHLALLLRREGDHVGAQRLDDRLRRRDDRKNV
jgi:chemotaxis protein methyltransferase WspC